MRVWRFKAELSVFGSRRGRSYRRERFKHADGSVCFALAWFVLSVSWREREKVAVLY